MTVLTRPLPFSRRLAAALISGFAVAALTHLAVLVALFVPVGATTAALVSVSDYYAATSVAFFVFASVAALAGAFRRWPLALLTGVVGAALAALVGVLFRVVSAGGSLTGDVLSSVFGTYVDNNFVYLVAAALVAALLAARVWRAVASAPHRSRVLVRMPSSRLAEGQLTHLERTEIDEELADAQWEAYVAALAAEGFDTVDVAPSDDHPDSVFIEDAVVVFGGTAVLASPGAESRRGETDAVRPVARRLGYTVRQIEQPGTLDGGDVLKVGTTVYVGRGGRTNGEGIAQLRAIVAPLGYTVVPVPVSKVLHLKSAVTALPDGTVVGYAKHVDAPALFDRFLALPEPGAAVVVLSEDAVLMSASTPKSTALIESLGYRVVTVDVSEFEKLEGCVTCLSVRLR